MYNNIMKKFGLTLLVISIAVLAGIVGGKYLLSKKVGADSPQKSSREFVWGATIRAYALADNDHAFSQDSFSQQFKFITDIFAKNGCVRANVEKDVAMNDLTVKMAKENNLKLYFVMEDIKDFNQDIDYASAAREFTSKIVPRYKGDVQYYQLSNELSGVVYSQPGEKGEAIDAGYGLKMNKKRYENVKTYTKAMSEYIRENDPNAKIVISGHWVLIDPIVKLIKDGVQADIIGWNWGSGISDDPGVKQIDNYGTMDLPKIASDLNKQFWIVEANKDDGSMNGKEVEQASYIEMLSQKAYQNPMISGYFHFILTDTVEPGPVGQQGLVKVQNGQFGTKKKAYSRLKAVASQ